MTTLSVGLMLPTAANTDNDRLEPDRTLAAAIGAEAAGFDGVYVGDHLMHPRPLLESVVTLSAVAARTDRVALGTCVMLVALRDPLLLAGQLRTLACLAPGRLRLGAGVGGEYPAEFEAAGVALAGRGRRLEEVLTEVAELLGRPHVPGRPALPGGPAEVPVLLGGHSERALARAAALGDGWIGYLMSPGGFAHRAAALRRARDRLGRSARPFVTGMLLPVQVDTGTGDARRAAARAWGRLTDSGDAIAEHRYVAGTVTEVVDRIGEYVSAGCEEVLLAPADQGDGYRRQLDTLAEQVLPALRAGS